MQDSREVTANERAIGKGAQYGGMVIISAVVLYSDVMFVSLMWNAFPGGFLTLAALGGAFATGISIIVLMVGKTHWFRPGGQLIFSWFFTGTELLVSVLNVITSVLVAEGKPLSYLAYWLLAAPASPFVALIGWVVVIYLDSARKQRHEEMEMEDQRQSSERDYKKAEHRAHMRLKQSFLSQYTGYLQEEVESAENLAILRQAARRLGKQVVSGLIGSPIAFEPSRITESVPPPPQLPSPQDDPEVAILRRLAEAAQQKGYSLESLERLLGVQTERETSPLPVTPNLNGAEKKKRP